MHKDMEPLCEALDTLGAAILAGWSGNQTFLEAWGWNCPAVTRQDMAATAINLASEIRKNGLDELASTAIESLNDMPRRLGVFQSQTLPQFWGGNCGPATSVYITTLDSIRHLALPMSAVKSDPWEVLADTKAMPTSIARRLRAINAELEQIVPDKVSLQKQVETIKEAHGVVETLSLDLADLSDKRARVNRLTEETIAASIKAKEGATETEGQLSLAKQAEERAQKIVGLCEEAYRTATTKGLAAAFDQRATRLGYSMTAWVIFLLAALVIAANIGSARVELLSFALANQNLHWGVILMHLVLSALSVGAPIWFAWLATKQVGQRFRLAEDYAFKASVAKAYEGYRKEAARLDPALEARLFSSALARLEEAPLRLVERDTHGSPWQELLASPQFQKALITVPELKDKFIELANKGISSLTPSRSS